MDYQISRLLSSFSNLRMQTAITIAGSICMCQQSMLLFYSSLFRSSLSPHSFRFRVTFSFVCQSKLQFIHRHISRQLYIFERELARHMNPRSVPKLPPSTELGTYSNYQEHSETKGLRIIINTVLLNQRYFNLFYLSCCCGRQKQYHSGDALLSSGSRGDKWEVSKHSVTKPTNAYGELEFQGAGQVSRAKVSFSLPCHSCKCLCTLYWCFLRRFFFVPVHTGIS